MGLQQFILFLPQRVQICLRRIQLLFFDLLCLFRSCSTELPTLTLGIIRENNLEHPTPKIFTSFFAAARLIVNPLSSSKYSTLFCKAICYYNVSIQKCRTSQSQFSLSASLSTIWGQNCPGLRFGHVLRKK